MSEDLILIYTASGQVEANFLKSLLEANSIPVLSVQEGMGDVYGLTVGILGEVNLWVTAKHEVAAQELIREYRLANNTEETNDE